MISSVFSYQRFTMGTLINKIYGSSFAVAKQNIPRRFQNRMPKRQKIFTVQDRKIVYNPFQALQLIRLHSFCTFKQSVEVCIKLGVNPKNGQQIVRGSAFMPSGIGKQTTVGVLCSKSQYEDLIEKGVKIDVFINDEQIKKLQKGIFEFEKLFTTPDHIGKIRHLGKALGPKGLMPNNKVGTLVKIEQLGEKIKQAKAGQITFRVDSGKNLHALIGKIDFTDEQLLINLRELMNALSERRPASLKGKYFIEAFIKSTMGPRWKINLDHIDPKSAGNIWNLLQLGEQNQEAEQSTSS